MFNRFGYETPEIKQARLNQEALQKRFIQGLSPEVKLAMKSDETMFRQSIKALPPEAQERAIAQRNSKMSKIILPRKIVSFTNLQTPDDAKSASYRATIAPMLFPVNFLTGNSVLRGVVVTSD